MGQRTNQICRIFCALTFSFGGISFPFQIAAAQTTESIDANTEQPEAVKKKKSGKKRTGKKKSAKGNTGDPETPIEMDGAQPPIESSGSAWIFLLSMITFLAGVIFWYRKYQAGESAKHLSDLNFGPDQGSGLTDVDQDTDDDEKSAGKKKHPLEAEQPVFAEASRVKPTGDRGQTMKMAAGSDLTSPDLRATVLMSPNPGARNQQSGPGAATVIISPLAATKIIPPETVEAKPIKKK